MLNNNKYLENIIKLSHPNVEIKSDYIFNEIKYQEVVAGTNIGILKQYKIKDLEKTKPNPDEIIVLDGTPDILPNVC